MIVYGFTGTRHGMTLPQMVSVLDLLWENTVTELHHGMCMGADTQAHYLAKVLEISCHKHPGPNKSGFCDGGISYEVLPFLERNRIIVDRSSGLIAAPQHYEKPESHPGGTWYTYQYALDTNKITYLVLPDGEIKCH